MRDEDIAKIVKEAVRETLTGLGFDLSQPNKVQADVMWVRRTREAREQIGTKITMAIVTSAVMAALYLGSEAVKKWVKGE
jgi:hypothetical protein